MKIGRYRPVMLALLVLHLSACTSWQPTFLSPPQVIEEEEPDRVRITRSDGDRVIIRNPEVRADSIAGSMNEAGSRTEMSVPISDIQWFEVRQPSRQHTIALVVILGFPVVLYGLLALLCTPSRTCDF